MIEYNKESALAVIAEAKETVERELEKIYPSDPEGTAAELYNSIKYSIIRRVIVIVFFFLLTGF